MSDQTIFGNTDSGSNPTPTGTPSTVPNVQLDPAIATLLSEIKNERGEQKYATLQDAIIGLKNSQEYIPTLKQQLTQRETELAEARAQAAKVAELQSAVEALTQREPTPPQGNAGLTPEQVAELVNRSLSDRERAELVKRNTALVASTLQTSLGADAERKYNEKAAELGMTPAELNALAAKSPKAVLGMFGVAAATPQAQSPGSVNTAALQPHQDSFVGRNKQGILMGATSQDQKKEQQSANAMVEELHAAGRSVYDLTDPKVYFKHFGG